MAESGSWQGLLDIYREAAEEAAAEADRPPTACYRCGTPLDVGPCGQAHCGSCGWTGR